MCLIDPDRGGLGSRFGKQCDTRGVAVEEVSPAHGTDLALRKKPGNRNVSHGFPNRADIVVRPTEEPAAATATAEQQCAKRRLVMSLSVGGHQKTQIVTGGRRVSNVELNGLSFLHDLADGEASGGAIRADQVSDEKVTPFEAIAMFIDDDAQV